MSARSQSRPRSAGSVWGFRHRRRLVITVVAIVVGSLGLIFAYQAAKASAALNRAANQGELLQTQIAGGDVESAKVTLVALQQSTNQARDNTGGILWDAGSLVPYFGRNLEALQTVSEVLDQIVGEALPPVVDLAESVNVNTFSPKNGRIDLKAIQKIGPSVAVADKVLTEGDASLQDVDADSLLAPLQDPVRKLKVKIANAQSAADASDTAVQLMPGMLGGNGGRKYLLIVQNNAEIRSTGGLPGSFAILDARGGKLSMGRQGGTSDLRPFGKPVAKLTKDELALYTDLIASDFRDVNFTPHFPRTGELARVMVDKAFGVEVDGVISVDPVLLSYILKGIGTVELPQGTRINSENAVDLLLNQAYSDYRGAQAQDDFFSDVSRAIFDAVTAGKGEERLIIEGLAKGAQEHRILVWSRDKREQRVLGSTSVSGALPGDTGKTPQVGLYLNDATGAKMQYYLDYRTVVKSTACSDLEVQTLKSTTILRSNAPADASFLPKSIVGSGFGGPLGSMRVNLRFYAPVGGKFTSVTVNGQREEIYVLSHQGRKVTEVSLLIKPGQKFTVKTSMASGKNQPGPAIFSTTPGINPTKNHVVVGSRCG